MEGALAYLIAFWLNAALHGFYVTLFLYWLSLPAERHALYFTVTSWVVFVLTNIDAAICFVMLVQGFWQSLENGGPVAYFASSSGWQFILQEFNYLVLIAVCDALMVYRVWRLWQEWRWIVIIPIVLLLAETVLRIVGDVYLALAIESTFEQTIASSLGLNTALQVVITLLLGYRLLRAEDLRLLPPEQRSTRFRIMRAIVESGLIVSVCLVLNLAFFVNDVAIHWTFNLSIPHLYAITSVAIVVRLRAASKRRKEWERTTIQTGTDRTATVWPRSTVVRVRRGSGMDDEDEGECAKPFESRTTGWTQDTLDLTRTNIEMTPSDTFGDGSDRSGVLVHKVSEISDSV